MRQPVSIAIWTALVCAWGCGSRDPRLVGGVEVKGVAPLGDDLAYVQSSGIMQRINVMADDPQPKTTKTSIRSAPRVLAKRSQGSSAANALADAGAPTGDELLIVSDGYTDAYGQVVEKPALTDVTVDNELRVYNLDQPGQLMRLSDDGAYAVLFDDPSQTQTDTLLTNRNEIAIVELPQPNVALKQPIIRTLDAVGGNPQALWFANLAIRDVGSQLTPFVLFSFPQGVSLSRLDVDDQGHKIPLDSWVPGTGSGAAPVADVQVDTANAKVYLRNSASSDVQVLSVTASEDSADGVDVSQNTLTVGTSAPSDFRVYALADSSTRLVATVGQSVAVVAADSNTVTAVPLTYTADRILPFDGTAPEDANPTGHRAVLYSAGATGVTFVDLENLEQETTKALQAVDLASPLSSVLQIPSMPHELIIFLSGGGIEVLDLQTRRWAPIGSAVGITATIADQSLNRSWVTSIGDTRVGFLDFGDQDNPALSIGEIRLDDPVSQFFRLDADALKRVIVTHDHIGGSLTVFDATGTPPARSGAKKLEGFLLSDLL